MNIKTFALAAVSAVGVAGAASAATLSVSGGTTQTWGVGNYKADCSGGITTCYDPAGGVAPTGLDLQGFFPGDTYPGPTISGASPIRVTFLGKEAGATNAAFSVAGGQVSNMDSIGSSFTSFVDGGILDFTFRVLSGAGGASTGSQAGSAGFAGTAAIAFSAVFNGGRSVYAFFDDSGAANDRDWDDMVVRIDVVPLPASALLLLGGLGGLAAVRRRKTA